MREDDRMPVDKQTNTSANKKRRKSSLRRRYLRFCRVHKFRPFTVTCVLLIACVLLFGGVFAGIRTVTFIQSRPVRFGMENIGELATQVGYYTNVQVISSSRELFGIDIPFTQNKYIFSYDGIVKAGFDFNLVEMTVDDISHTITVKLPETKILSNEIDEQSLEVYDETKNIFNPLKLNDMNLSLITLKEQAEENAIANGLLENARSNAEVLIRSFLAGSFDLQKYSILFE